MQLSLLTIFKLFARRLGASQLKNGVLAAEEFDNFDNLDEQVYHDLIVQGFKNPLQVRINLLNIFLFNMQLPYVDEEVCEFTIRVLAKAKKRQK